MIGIQLGDRQSRHARIEQNGRECRERRVLAEADVAPGVLRERRIREVDAVDVEMHSQTVAAGEHRQRLSGGRAGSAATAATGIVTSPRLSIDSSSRRRALIPRSCARKTIWSPSSSGMRGPKLTQLGRGLLIAEHVRDAHPVERAVDGRCPDVLRSPCRSRYTNPEPRPLHGEVSGHRAEPDRAVAAEHERELAGVEHLARRARQCSAAHSTTAAQVLGGAAARGPGRSATPRRRRDRPLRFRPPPARREDRRRAAHSAPSPDRARTHRHSTARR